MPAWPRTSSPHLPLPLPLPPPPPSPSPSLHQLPDVEPSMQPGSREMPSQYDVPVRRVDTDGASASLVSLQVAPLSVYVQQQQQQQLREEEEQEQEQQPQDEQEHKPSMQGLSSSSTPPAIHLKKWASEEEWTIHRPKICRIYLHERKTLKEVMATMERDHEFYATIKMYKAHFKKWGINKNLKLSDAEALLLSLTKDVQRSGRIVSRRQVEVYFKRRKHYPQPPKTQSVGDIALAMEDTASLDPHATAAALPPLPRLTMRPASDGHEVVLRFVRRYLDINFSTHTWVIKPNAIRFGHKHMDGHDYFSSVFFRLFLDGRQALSNPHTRQQGGKLLNLAFARLRPALRLESGLLLRTAVRMITTQAQQEPHTVDLARMLWRYIYDLGKVILGPTHPFLDCWKSAETHIVFAEQYGQLPLLMQFVAAESGRFAARLGRHDELFQALAQCRADEIMGDDEYGLQNAERRLRLLLDRLQGLPDDVPWKEPGEQRVRVELAWNLHDQGMLTGSKEILDQSLAVSAPLPDLPYNYHRLLGWLELGRGRQREAEAAFRKAVQLADAAEGPGSSSSFLMLADLKDCLQYFGGARAELQAQKLDREMCHRRRAAAEMDSSAATGAHAVNVEATDTMENPAQIGTLVTTRDVP